MLTYLGENIAAVVGIFLSAVGCFLALEIYLYTRACPDYNTFTWKTDIEPETNLKSPSFAILRGVNDTAYANFSSESNKCFYPRYGDINCSLSFTYNSTYYSHIYGLLYYQIFDSGNPSNITLTSLSDKVILQTFVTCKYGAPASRTFDS